MQLAVTEMLMILQLRTLNIKKLCEQSLMFSFFIAQLYVNVYSGDNLT